jgi:hypothetical protein
MRQRLLWAALAALLVAGPGLTSGTVDTRHRTVEISGEDTTLRRWMSVTALSASGALGVVSHLEAQTPTPRIDRATPDLVELEPGGAVVRVELEGVSLDNLTGAQVLLRGRPVVGVTATLPASRTVDPTRRTVELSAADGASAQSGLEVVLATAGARPVQVRAPLRVVVVEAAPLLALMPQALQPMYFSCPQPSEISLVVNYPPGWNDSGGIPGIYLSQLNVINPANPSDKPRMLCEYKTGTSSQAAGRLPHKWIELDTPPGYHCVKDPPGPTTDATRLKCELPGGGGG